MARNVKKTIINILAEQALLSPKDISENSSLDSLVVTDTIPLNDAAKSCSRIRQLSMAKLLAESIRRVSNEESISAMFDNT